MPTGKMWTSQEIATLRRMAASGASVGEAARALSRSRVGVRSRATHEGISFRHAIRNKSPRVSLPPDLDLRLRLAAKAAGAISPHQLARDLLSSVLSSRNRAEVVEATLGAVRAREMKQQPVEIAPPSPPSFIVFLGPTLGGRVSGHQLFGRTS
jgi:hypothetical protein